MTVKDPSEIPPNKDEDEASPTAQFIGTFVVDGIVQLGLTAWLRWLLAAPFAITFNFWLFWLGSVIFYMSLHWHDKMMAGRVLVHHIFVFMIATVCIWIFL